MNGWTGRRTDRDKHFFFSLFRMFRRGSRAGVSEQDISNPFSPPSGASSPASAIRRDFTQSLNLADMFNRRGSAPPATSPISVSPQPMSDEDAETHSVLNDFDEIINLFSNSNTTDRLEQQRSPMPPPRQTIPRYLLPTSHANRMIPGSRSPIGWSATPMYSMPDLSVGRVEEESEEYVDSETSPISPGGDEGAPSAQYACQDKRQQYKDEHQRSVSYDMTYDPQTTGDLVEDDFKTHSAVNMGVSDQMVDRYWEVATPPRTTPPAASTPSVTPPSATTPTYGNFLSPDDAKRYLPSSHLQSSNDQRSASPLAQKSYTIDSPDKVTYELLLLLLLFWQICYLADTALLLCLLLLLLFVCCC